MTTIQAILLGIVQGLTEFLPVSSSGHLVLFSRLFSVPESSLVFEIVVHVGTLLAVLLVFRNEIGLLINSFLKLLKNPKQWKILVKDDPGCRLLVALVVGTLPAVAAALFLKQQIEGLFNNSLFVGLMLILTGTILYLTEHHKAGGKGLEEISTKDAILIGCGQAVALFPGISRSGSTIAMGLFRGLERESAARFSFLLSVPAIFGALVFSLDDIFAVTTDLGFRVLATGLVASALTGYFAIHFLLELVKKGKLVWFSYYTWVVGAVVVFLHLV